MTTTREKFEALLLDGRDRSNPLVGSQLNLGADGEYFNSNTRALYRFYLAGWEHACKNAAEDVIDNHCATDGHTPIVWPGTGGTYCEVCSVKLEDEPGPEPDAVNQKGIDIDPDCLECHGKGDGNGNKCPWCFEEIPW
jgi:hypothetical protein